MNTYRPAWNDFEVTTVYGSAEAKRTLLGDALPWDAWEPLLDERFALGGAYMIPHGTFDWGDDIGRRYIPDWEPSASPDAWHPDDELFVPMRHTDGHLLGIISVGEPRSGMRPSADDVAGLVAVADHAALALQSAQEAAAAAFHRAALRQLLQVSSRLTETLSAGAILQSVCEGISEALGFDKVCIDLPDPVTGVFTLARGHRLDARGHAPEHADDAVGAGPAARSAVRAPGLLSALAGGGDRPPSRRAHDAPLGDERARARTPGTGTG